MMTTRQRLTALLAEPLVLEVVVGSSTSYAGRFNWRRGDSVAKLVDALGRARCLRAALAVALFSTGALVAVQSVAWPSQARSLRRLAYCEGALEPRRKSNADDRCKANARAWGLAS